MRSTQRRSTLRRQIHESDPEGRRRLRPPPHLQHRHRGGDGADELDREVRRPGDQGRALRQEAFTAVTLLLNPITPHTSHALWQLLGHAEATLEDQAFPVADPAALVREGATLAVQVNGKLRATLEVSLSASKESIEALALAEPNVQKFMEGLTVRKVIVVPGKIVNIVAG